MSKPKGAILKLISILLLILGIWFFIPSEADLVLMILDALAKATYLLDVEQSNQIAGMLISFFRFFVYALMVVDVLAIVLVIYTQLKRIFLA